MEWRMVYITERGHMAYLDPDEHWNGFVRPWFTKEEALAMNEWLGDFEDSIVYDEERDLFYTTYDPECREEFAGRDIDGYHLYPIGNGSWTWCIDEEE